MSIASPLSLSENCVYTNLFTPSGEALEGKAEYPFYNSRQEGEVYYLQGDMQMTDNPSHRVGLFARQGKVQTFSIPKAGPVQELSDWSEWQQGEAVKFRWRMAAAR
jgi:hypothetical protein